MNQSFIDRLKNYETSYQRVSCWVYTRKNKPLIVYQEQKPNTQEVFIQFFNMNHYFWNFIQTQCIEQIQGFNEKDIIAVYNTKKLKNFIMKYMIKDWSFDYQLKRNFDGSLEQETLNYIYGLHPRILRVLLDKYTCKQGFTQQQQGKIQKQCYLLFDKGSSVSNPHWSISLYCDLTSFWQKFGLNYYDIQQLPENIYDGLRKVMSSESKISNSKLKSNNKGSSNQKQIRF